VRGCAPCAARWRPAALIIGYAAPPEHAYAATVKALMGALSAGKAAVCVRFRT
jgi:hypothetical protein